MYTPTCVRNGSAIMVECVETRMTSMSCMLTRGWGLTRCAEGVQLSDSSKYQVKSDTNKSKEYHVLPEAPAP